MGKPDCGAKTVSHRNVHLRLTRRQTGNNPDFMKEMTMFQLAITCLLLALIAAVLGFGGMAGSFVGVAKILFVVFLASAVLSFFFGNRMRRNTSEAPTP